MPQADSVEDAVRLRRPLATAEFDPDLQAVLKGDFRPELEAAPLCVEEPVLQKESDREPVKEREPTEDLELVAVPV